MDTKTMEYMVSIAEYKSISKAAEKHYLSSSALSQHIKKIEGELGTKIFEYKNNEMQQTEAGVIFINCCRRILYEETELEKELCNHA